MQRTPKGDYIVTCRSLTFGDKTYSKGNCVPMPVVDVIFSNEESRVLVDSTTESGYIKFYLDGSICSGAGNVMSGVHISESFLDTLNSEQRREMLETLASIYRQTNK
jgi:hypothetical protein